MSTTESLLPSLVSRWEGVGTLGDVVADLQYNIYEPLEDGVKGVKVSFGITTTAEIGNHEAPDLEISLSGSTFEALANDTLDLAKPKEFARLSVKSNSRRGAVLGKRLLASFNSRP